MAAMRVGVYGGTDVMQLLCDNEVVGIPKSQTQSCTTLLAATRATPANTILAANNAITDSTSGALRTDSDHAGLCEASTP